MKHDYTGKFSVGQTVYLNDKSIPAHGHGGTVTEINLNGRGYPYRVDFNITHAYHTEIELSEDPILKIQKQAQPKSSPEWESMDISSGFGIGGIGSDDYNIGTEMDTNICNTGRCSWGGTRYDEECASCGRVTAICNDCELCEKCHD